MIGQTPTIVGILDSINNQYGLPDNIPVEQTVNYQLGLPNPANTNARKVMGIMFGRDGRDMRSANRNALYSPLPLIIRPLSSPLTTIERQAYFLRHVTVVNGVSYEVYYGKTIDIQSPLAVQRYLSYTTPTDNHQVTPLNFIPLDTNLSNTIANEAVIKVSTSYFINFTATDVASMSDACLLLKLPPPVIRELGIISGKAYEVSAGVVEATRAICINHASIYPALSPPGIEIQLGTINGVKL